MSPEREGPDCRPSYCLAEPGETTLDRTGFSIQNVASAYAASAKAAGVGRGFNGEGAILSSVISEKAGEALVGDELEHVCEVGDLANNEMRRHVTGEGRTVAICRVRDEFFASMTLYP